MIVTENGFTFDTDKLLEDLHALMWFGDGCEICTHCVVEQREPYYKTRCALDECVPLWRGMREVQE